MSLMAGSAKVDITPRSPTRLTGYAARTDPHDGVLDPISLRALYVRGSSGDALLVTADILWFYSDAVERMQEAMSAELGLLPDRILFCGTHTHGAPEVRQENANPEWVAHLESKALAAAALAKLRLEPVTVKGGRGSCDIGINRRELLPDGRVILGKNPDGPIEDGKGRYRPIAIKGIRIGPVRLVGFPGEVFSQTTMAVKGESPHEWTMVGSYTAGGHGGYIPVKEAYDLGGYEVGTSPYSEDGEAVLREGFVEMLQGM